MSSTAGFTNETSFVSVVDNQDHVLSGANFAAIKIPYKSTSIVDSLCNSHLPGVQSSQVTYFVAVYRLQLLRRHVLFIKIIIHARDGC